MGISEDDNDFVSDLHLVELHWDDGAPASTPGIFLPGPLMGIAKKSKLTGKQDRVDWSHEVV